MSSPKRPRRVPPEGSSRRSSASNERLLYCRAVILLTSCCSHVMRAFILQTVKNNDPGDDDEYTLDKFLRDRSASFYRSAITGKRRKVDPAQEEILYLNPQGIETWDLSLLSYVAMEMCGLSHAARMDFDMLRNIRNILFHSADGKVTNEKYIYLVDHMKVAYKRLLDQIDNMAVRKELADALDDAETDNKSLMYARCDQEMQQMNKWVERDKPIREKMDISGEEPDGIQKLVQTLVDAKKKERVAPEILDLVISIAVKNVGAREERFIIKKLFTYLDPNHRNSESRPARASALHDVGPAIEKALHELISNGREIADVQYGCKVRIKCHSYEGLKDLVLKIIQGEVTRAFRKVEQMLHRCQGYENAEFEVILTEDDYCRFITTLGASLQHDCEDLIKQMLTVDCNKRMSVEQIIHHHWMRNNSTNREFQQLIEEYNAKVDGDLDIENLNETILTQMETVHRLDIENLNETILTQMETVHYKTRQRQNSRMNE